MERQRWHIVLIIVIHVIVYFAVNTTLMIQAWGIEKNDYTMNYMNAVKNFLQDPVTLYDAPDPRIRLRTLPAVVLYYAIFYLISPTSTGGLLACDTWMLLWNIFSAYLIFRITKLERFQAIQTRGFLKDPRVLILLFLCYTWQSGEYYGGQTNSLAGFFIILGIYYFMQSKDHLGFLAWGISTTFKLFSAFLILFFLLKSKKRDIWRNLLFLAISMLPNLLMFLAWSPLFFAFIEENVSTALALSYYFFPSASFARMLSVASMYRIPFIPSVAIVLGVGLPLVILVFLKYGKNMNVMDQAIVAFTCGIVVFPDFYPGHSVMLWGLFLLWLATRNDYVNGTIKSIYFGVLFYIIPSVYNPLYAVPFLVLLVWLLVMFVRPVSRNQERLLGIDHAGLKTLLPIYIISFVDTVIVFKYTGVFG